MLPVISDMKLSAGGSDLNAQDTEDRTLLYRAVEHGDRKRVEALLRRGADPEARTSAGISPLYAAAYLGNITIMRLLIEHKADVNGRIVDDLTPLFAASENDHAPAVAFLVEHGADVNVRTLLRATETPLHQAALGGSVNAAKVLIEHGADVNARNSKGMTPLHLAAVAGHEEMMACLVAYGADASISDVYGQTAWEALALMRKREGRPLLAAAEHLPSLHAEAIVKIVYVALTQGGMRFKPPRVGFAVNNGAWVITAAHCTDDFIEDPRAGDLVRPLILSVHLGDLVEAEIIGTDEENDLAVLRPQWRTHPALELAGESRLAKGMEVAVAGYPPISLADGATQSGGTVCVEPLPVLQYDPKSGKRSITLGGARYVGPGWSGSPIVQTDSGLVLGVFGNQDKMVVGEVVLYQNPLGCDVYAIQTLLEKEAKDQSLGEKQPDPPDSNAEGAFAAALDYFAAFMEQEHNKALDAVREWKQLRPHSAWVHLLLAWTSLKMGQTDTAHAEKWDQAEPSFLEALRIAPDNAAVHAAFGHALLGEKRYDEARRELERALDIEPALPFALAHLVSVLTEIDPQYAAERGRRFVEQMPENAPLWFAYAGALRRLERFDDAVEAARSAVRYSRDDQYWFRGRLADVLAKSGRIDEAETCYKELLDRNPESPVYQQWYDEFLRQYRPGQSISLESPRNSSPTAR